MSPDAGKEYSKRKQKDLVLTVLCYLLIPHGGLLKMCQFWLPLGFFYLVKTSYSFIASSPTPWNYMRRLEIFNENFRYSCSNFWETQPLISCCFWSFLLGDYIPVRAYILLISSWGCDSLLFLDSLEVMSDQQVGFLASWLGSYASGIKSRVWFL